MNDLSEIPTADLLNEIALRCRPSEKYNAPAWARPVLAAVACEAGIPVERLVCDTSRARFPARYRSVAMALLHDQTDRASAEIARIWGCERSTVDYAIKRVRSQVLHPNVVRDFLSNVLSRMGAMDGHAPRRTAPHAVAGGSEHNAPTTRLSETPSRIASQEAKPKLTKP